jgi:large subunit ribosomal protein L33
MHKWRDLTSPPQTGHWNGRAVPAFKDTRRIRKGREWLEICSGMAGGKKGISILIKLVSTAGTGYFYVKRKNPRNLPNRLQFVKYDPRVRQHVLFTEQKLK